MTGEREPAHAGEIGAVEQETILVVEDEVLVRTAVSMHLRDCGFLVVEAVDAEEAMRALDAEPAIRLVFSDVNMPGPMDGNGLARWLKKERPGVKILLASGAGWPAGTAVEGVPRLTKPYSFFEIERLIRGLLD